MANILFVEPDNSLGKIYLNYFQNIGHQVVWVQNADDAIKYLDENQPEVVVIELLITTHNGLELLYEMRSYPEWSSVKVILNTSAAETKLLKSPVYKRLGIAKYLYKPNSTLRLLNDTINSVLSSKL